MSHLTIIKQDHRGEETWRYEGVLQSRDAESLVLEAFFEREEMQFHGLTLRPGDRFLETYFWARGYNIFEIYDAADGCLKGWYCNVSSPATLRGEQVIYRDLALDLLVFPDGRQVVLDADEFEALNLPTAEREKALASLAELQALFREKLKTGGG